MTSPEGLLIVEDNHSSAFLYQAWLENQGETIKVANTGHDVVELLDQGFHPAVALLDMHLPDTTGLELLNVFRQRKLASKIVVITSDTSTELAIEAMKEGAHDYLLKPVDDYRLRVSIANALSTAKLENLASSFMAGDEEQPVSGFVGTSPPMQALYKTLKLAALSDAPVFISGESGTGKELCAQAIHQLSRRNQAPIVSVNCATMPTELVESQLFGHVKGAFTGAIQSRRGLAEEASGGTLFLDELTELSLDVQSKLLRFLQTGEITPVGASSSKHVNCRLVCANNTDIREAVASGRFRQDLFYRLHVIPVQVPPLRDRGDDITLLAANFLKRYALAEGRQFRGFSRAAMNALLAYPWPGNVRELQNTIRHAVIMHDGELLDLPMLIFNPASNLAHKTSTTDYISAQQGHTPHSLQPLWQLEKEAIERTLQHFNGNVTKAAALLEVAPSTLYRKIKEYGGSV